jgi:hypothetical protein
LNLDCFENLEKNDALVTKANIIEKSIGHVFLLLPHYVIKFARIHLFSSLFIYLYVSRPKVHWASIHFIFLPNWIIEYERISGKGSLFQIFHIAKVVSIHLNFRSLSPDGPQETWNVWRKNSKTSKKKKCLSQKKANDTLEDRAAQLEKLQKWREKRKALETVQERNFKIAANERRPQNV